MAMDAQLDTLEAKGLIRLASYRPELEYLFRHWLVQDAAYGSLLKQERRALHRQVGEALELLYPDRLEELAPVLALHFEQAGDSRRAIDYLLTVGDHALTGAAIREAFSAFDRAAGLLPVAADEEEPALRRLRVEIAIGRARSSWPFRPVDELIAELETVVPAAEKLGDPGLVAAVHLNLALGMMQSGLPATDPKVRRSLDKVTEIGEQINDPSLRAMPLAIVGLNQVVTGPLRDGVRALEEAIPLMEQRQDVIGASFARGSLAMGYAELGEFEKAEEAAREASELAVGGDLIAQLDAAIAEAMVRSARGQLDEAVPLAQACVVRSEETGATACAMVSSWVLGDVLGRQGRLEESRIALQRGTEIAMVVDRKVWRPTLQAWLSSTAASIGDKAAAAGEWQEAIDQARSIGNHMGEAGIRWKHAQSSAAHADVATALAEFEASATILESEGSRPTLARVLRDWGESLRSAGRGPEGAEKLRRALAFFEEMGIGTEAEQVRGLLADPKAERTTA
jgi:tetratricopeptide (TPR) repeat protein